MAYAPTLTPPRHPLTVPHNLTVSHELPLPPTIPGRPPDGDRYLLPTAWVVGTGRGCHEPAESGKPRKDRQTDGVEGGGSWAYARPLEGCAPRKGGATCREAVVVALAERRATRTPGSVWVTRRTQHDAQWNDLVDCMGSIKKEATVAESPACYFRKGPPLDFGSPMGRRRRRSRRLGFDEDGQPWFDAQDFVDRSR